MVIILSSGTQGTIGQREGKLGCEQGKNQRQYREMEEVNRKIRKKKTRPVWRRVMQMNTQCEVA